MAGKRTRELMIIAGEASGDAYGAALVRELLRREPNLDFCGLGGPRMAAEGVRLFQDMTGHSVVGAMGLVGSTLGFARARRRVSHRLSSRPPDALILIDFPWFNLILARHARRVGVPVIYYVSPQVWAWHTGRIRLMARCVRKMICFFEFERELYERAGLDAVCVGHPLLDTMADKLGVTDRRAVRRSLGLPEDATLVGLLPGSRQKEVDHVFPVILEASERLQEERSDLAFAAVRAPGLDADRFRRLASRHPVELAILAGRAHDVMLAADLLLVCSGTATLEAALLGTPMVVTYHSDRLSYIIFGSLITVKHWALPNIVAGEPIVPECYMVEGRPRHIAAAARDLLDGRLEETRRRLGVIRRKLGRPGASGRAAEEVLKLL